MTASWQRDSRCQRPIVSSCNLHHRRLEFDSESLGLLALVSVLRVGDSLLLLSFGSFPHSTEIKLLYTYASEYSYLYFRVQLRTCDPGTFYTYLHNSKCLTGKRGLDGKNMLCEQPLYESEQQFSWRQTYVKSTHWVSSRGPTRLGISLGVHFLEERFLELCESCWYQRARSLEYKQINASW